MPPHHTLEQAARLVYPNCHLTNAVPLMGGISAETIKLTIQTSTDATTHLVLRHFRRRPDNTTAKNERDLLHKLAATAVRVPAPLYFGPKGSLLDGPFILMQYVDGRFDIAPRNTTTYLAQYADQLVQLHQLPTAEYQFVKKVEPANSELARGKRQNALCDTLPLRDLLVRHDLTMRNAERLLHGDYWPGNVLWHNGRLVAVIDWEDAKIGDPLVDLAIARLDMATTFGPTSAEIVTTRYLSQTQLDTSDLPYWDLCACLRYSRIVGDDLASWVSDFPGLGRPDITKSFIHANFKAFMHRAQHRLQS